jgi:iron only hydrogenase large subunit-like protein
MQRQTIYTIRANCQDCYRCVRECPVKAIRINNGQAQVEDDLCIKCGTCVRECPQLAKTVRSDLEEAQSLLSTNRTVVASVAPSFAARFPGVLSRRIPSALRQLGFKYVCETAEGAKYVTEQSFTTPQKGSICTACPAIVNFIEKYHSNYLEALIPVVSPMIAHGRMLKEQHQDCAVIFIGPCAAKKQEISRPENVGAVDVVLTFTELLQWLSSENVQLENCSESNFDQFNDIGDARLFPIMGGMLKTGNIQNDGTQANVLHLSGAEDIMDLFSETPNLYGKLIEPLFCKGGCVGGPCFGNDESIDFEHNLFARRENVINYADAAKKNDKTFPKIEISHQSAFVSHEQEKEEVTENQIHKVLELTGKIDLEYQLNCGACGYKTCLENAAAVVRGMAEPEMCIPYMRRLAQQRTDRVIDTTPNGVVILDGELCIVKMNPAFQRMFTCNNGILGRRISYLVNADGFEALHSGATEKSESIQVKYGIKYHEILYALREENQYIGIYSDISKIKYDPGQLDTIKTQTLMHAREFLDHQVRFAQEMAHYLGKSTAQSEEIAKRLIGLYEENSNSAEPN